MTIENRICATCAHWQPFHPGGHSVGPDDARQLGLCSGVGQEREGHTHGLDMAQVEDLSGCAGLRTAPNFGCLLWEAR